VPIPRTEEENAGITVVTDMPIDGHSRQATIPTRDGNVKLCSYLSLSILVVVNESLSPRTSQRFAFFANRKLLVITCSDYFTVGDTSSITINSVTDYVD
jgi:hypothetical protein